MLHDEIHRGNRLPQSDGRGHEHEIREPRDAHLRANLARASIGTELLTEARGPAIALAFQTPIAPKGQCRLYRAFSIDRSMDRTW